MIWGGPSWLAQSVCLAVFLVSSRHLILCWCCEGSPLLVVAGMKLNFFELREATYHFYQALSQCLGPDFQPLLKTVMTFALVNTSLWLLKPPPRSRSSCGLAV